MILDEIGSLIMLVGVSVIIVAPVVSYFYLELTMGGLGYDRYHDRR